MLAAILGFAAGLDSNKITGAPLGRPPLATAAAADACTGSSANLNPDDCSAWQDLYGSTKGSSWTKCSSNRLDPCACGGNYVSCTDGRITKLWLGGHNLVGTLPASFSNMTKLTRLVLGENKLTGLLPALTFEQYTSYCCLEDDHHTNLFDCPLPLGADKCNGGDPKYNGSCTITCTSPTCTGSSSSLPQSECEWWINFFDTMGGKEWKKCASERYRTDPCACSYDCNKGPCRDGVTCTNGHITKL
jgi:hypothetical protein